MQALRGMLGFALVAGGFSAIVATLLASVLLVVFWFIPSGAYSAGDALVLIPIFCLYTAVPAGVFGTFCGTVGGAFLFARAKSITSRLHLLGESAVVGIVLSLIFPVVCYFSRWGFMAGREGLLLSVGVGLPTSALFVVFFGGRLLKRSAEINAQTSCDRDASETQLT